VKKILTLLVVAAVAVLGAYVAGYWPQRQRLQQLETERAALQQRADTAEARLRVGALLGELLTLKETVQEMNYGQARGLSSPFFEKVRAEAGRATDPALKPALEAVLAVRDQVTVALTQGDPSSLTHLREGERRLRAALGYPAPPPIVSTMPPLTLPGMPTPVPAAPGATLVPAPSAPLGLPSPAPAAPTPLPTSAP
jgi:hypothetical protein